METKVGGAARREVITILIAVLALDSADKATIGAVATELQTDLGVGKAAIGLLLSISSLIGAVATLPAGVLVDKMNRTRMLTWSVVLWALAMVACACAPSFLWLIAGQVGLGVVTAVAGPSIASLIGDYFPPAERGRIYSFVLTGELVGVGIGFVVAGALASVTWRAAFLALAVPAAGVAWFLHRLPEPARGGASRLPPGARDIRSAEDIETGQAEPYLADDGPTNERPVKGPAQSQDLAAHEARRAGVEADRDLVMRTDPAHLSLWQAIRYILSIRTNIALIVASALGYFFFSGVRGFGVEFLKKHFGLNQGTASLFPLLLGIGAVAGVLIGGRLGDSLLRRGLLSARVIVAGIAVLAAGMLFVPALLTHSLLLAIPLLLLATACLGAANPPLDAARLDIMPFMLWGRAEAVRGLLRNGGDAIAPLAFGVLAQEVFVGRDGLKDTFLLMLVPLCAAAILALVWARRTYPQDVVTATVSERVILEGEQEAAGKQPAPHTSHGGL
jgi:MFS family permease